MSLVDDYLRLRLGQPRGRVSPDHPDLDDLLTRLQDAEHTACASLGRLPPAQLPGRLAFARTLGGLMPQVAGIRRFGAAALDLAWVAAGRFDGYWELGIKPWDMNAGLLIVREAGGYATDPFGGDPRENGNMVAANPVMHPLLCTAVQEGMQTRGATPTH